MSDSLPRPPQNGEPAPSQTNCNAECQHLSDIPVSGEAADSSASVRQLDTFFHPRYVPNRYSDRVTRWAVLNPFFPNCRRSVSAIPAATIALVMLWRQTLGGLAQLGWAPGKMRDPAAAARNLQFVQLLPDVYSLRAAYTLMSNG